MASRTSEDNNYFPERQRMLEADLLGRDIKNQNVLQSTLKVPRESFVGESNKAGAYGDYPISIGNGQTISQPYIVALMLQYLDIKKGGCQYTPKGIIIRLFRANDGRRYKK